MSSALTYRVPRRFIAFPDEPAPYGLLAMSFVGHVLAFSLTLAVSTYLSSRLDQSKIYVVNLVPDAPTAGSPTARVPERPAPKAETRTPPRPEAPPAPKAETRSPPKAETPPPPPRPAPRTTEPATPPRPTEVAETAPPRPSEVPLPSRAQRPAPPLEPTGPRVAATPPPPPPPAAGATTARPPEAPRVAPFTAAPPPPVTTPAPPAPPVVAAAPRPGTDLARPGRSTATASGVNNIGLDVSDFPFTYYLRQVKAKVEERFSPPRPALAGGERATITFVIGRDGQLLREPVVEKSSGNALYDQAAVRAVTDAKPFPPLPQEMKGSHLTVHFGFDFQPDQG